MINYLPLTEAFIQCNLMEINNTIVYDRSLACIMRKLTHIILTSRCQTEVLTPVARHYQASHSRLFVIFD